MTLKKGLELLGEEIGGGPAVRMHAFPGVIPPDAVLTVELSVLETIEGS